MKTTTQQIWYLEGAVDDSGQVFRLPITRDPFRIGREPGLDLSLPSQSVSSHHAEIHRRGDHLVVIDLASTNGTFVNKLPVQREAPLADGDTLQLASLPFRVCRAEAEAIDSLLSSTATIDTREAVERAETLHHFRVLLETEAVTQVLQPIVHLADGEVLGYEALGRGAHPDLPTEIDALFQLAQPLGAEVVLSRLLRRSSAGACNALERDVCFFLNTHPAELDDAALIESLQTLRRAWPELRIAIEIHESAVTEPGFIRELAQELVPLDMLLVYDDFGSGQARLIELVEVPPAYLKFDRSLIQQIDTAPAARVSLLESLTRMALDLEIPIIAEGIERPAEAERCAELGFAYGQGFLFGRPCSVEEIDGAPRSDLESGINAETTSPADRPES